MFEQSILTDDANNRPWSFVASATAELLVVSLLILIPLGYTDHLPGFHWKNVVVGPPVHLIQQPVLVHTGTTTSSLRPVFTHAARIFNPMSPSRSAQYNVAEPTQLDIPPGAMPSSDGSPTAPLDAVWKPPVARGPTTATNTSKTTAAPLHVSQGVQMAKIVRQVLPIYPPLAKQTHTSGVVHLIGVIAKDGTIQNLQIISGHPLLARAAVEAVQQWVYKPTLLNGEAVEVICPIDVNFTLSQ